MLLLFSVFRKRRNLRNDLAMTPEDTELSSSALGTDPFERYVVLTIRLFFFFYQEISSFF